MNTVLPPLSLAILTVPLGGFSRSMWRSVQGLIPRHRCPHAIAGTFYFFPVCCFSKEICLILVNWP